MPVKTLFHIVPRLRPQADGAGDYAFNLARELRASYGIQSQFIVCDPKRDGPSRLDNFVVQRLRVKNEAGIWNLLAPANGLDTAVLFHYCPYGYHKQGLPVWLYRGIKSWQEEHIGTNIMDSKHLITVFHETLQSPLKPWNKEFCLRALQKWLLHQFHRHSQFSVTNDHALQALLYNIMPHKTMWSPMPRHMAATSEHIQDWKFIARQYNEVLHQDLLGVKTSELPDRLKENIQRAPPVYASGIKTVESPVARLQRPA